MTLGVRKKRGVPRQRRARGSPDLFHDGFPTWLRKQSSEDFVRRFRRHLEEGAGKINRREGGVEEDEEEERNNRRDGVRGGREGGVFARSMLMMNRPS